EIGECEERGDDRAGHAVQRPCRLPRGEGRGDLGVGSGDVAGAQTGTGEDLREGTDHDRVVATRPVPGREWIERLVPHVGGRGGGREPAGGVVRIRPPSRRAGYVAL